MIEMASLARIPADAMEEAIPTRVRRRRRRRRRSLKRRVLSWLEQHVSSSFKVSVSAKRTMTMKERWQVLGFTTALIVAMLTAFTIIMLEDRPVAPDAVDVR